MREDTLQRVAQFADKVLLEEQRVVTANEIKQAIGGGSDQVRAAHAVWTANLAERLRKVECLPGIPPALSNALVSAWRDVVGEAQEQAKEALAEHEQKANQNVEAAEERVTALQAVLGERESEIDALRIQLDERETAFCLQEAELISERAKVHAGLVQAKEVRERADRSSQQLQSEITALRSQLETAYQRSDAQEQRYVGLLEEQKTARHKLEQRLAETEAAARESGTRLQNKILEMAETSARLRAELSVSQKQGEFFHQRVTTLESERHDLQLKYALLVEKLETSQSAHTELVKLHQEKLDAMSKLHTELSSLRAEKNVWEEIAKNLREKPK